MKSVFQLLQLTDHRDAGRLQGNSFSHRHNSALALFISNIEQELLLDRTL